MVEGRNKIIDKQNLLLRRSGNGYVSFKDVRRIVFRGACLSMIPNSDAITSSSSLQQHRGTTRKTKHTKDRDDTKAFCTERTSLLLACSLQYCASTHRRNALVSTMIGPIVLARRARINMLVTDRLKKVVYLLNSPVCREGCSLRLRFWREIPMATLPPTSTNHHHFPFPTSWHAAAGGGRHHDETT